MEALGLRAGLDELGALSHQLARRSTDSTYQAIDIGHVTIMMGTAVGTSQPRL